MVLARGGIVFKEDNTADVVVTDVTCDGRRRIDRGATKTHQQHLTDVGAQRFVGSGGVPLRTGCGDEQQHQQRETDISDSSHFYVLLLSLSLRGGILPPSA